MNQKDIILAHEREFAARLASRVIIKPKLSAWMIFIPVIFVFYFYDFSKYKKQRETFIDNWILSRKRMLNETSEALDEDWKPDMEALSRAATDLPEKSKKTYMALLKVLDGHYTRLLKADADTYPALVRSAYRGKKGDYLYYVNQLQDAEKALNKILAPQLKKTSPNAGETITKIETQSDKIRRREIDQFFQQPGSGDTKSS